jgi:bifunctional NMN adenylyltransferase/nudix hydrolase
MAGLNIGVVIGRFQVPELHAGHLHLFTEVASRSDRVVVFLGVSPIDGYASEYPLTFSQRQAMLQRCLPPSVEYTIMPLPDRKTDDEWTTQIDVILDAVFPSDTVILYGGRDSFTEHYKGHHHVERMTFVPVIPVAGTDIRKAIKPATASEFLRGQIHGICRQYPKVYPTVDIAHVRYNTPMTPEVLLIQRADTGSWCFPGGFVDPTDMSLEFAAKRELSEELGLISEAPVEYIGSVRINDWRYRGSRDKVLTNFFYSQHSFGSVRPNYDEVQDYLWVSLDDLRHPSRVSDTHQPLVPMLLAYAEKKGM